MLIARQLFIRLWTGSIETIGWLELVLAVSGGLLAYEVGQQYQIKVADRVALYNAMMAIPLGLMAVSAIVVTLSSALSARSATLAQSIGTVATVSFVPIIALFISVLIGLLLLAAGDLLPRSYRYSFAGAWCGLVVGATIRAIGVGRVILMTNLRANTKTGR